ncbi:MAG: hypothetical protein ABL893_05030 [Hyphomicrobium sp.]|nr:hypothetical protein [Hyphomicrobium sp.]
MYRTLHPDKVTETIEALTRRIGDRFPQSGLFNVSRDLVELSRQTTSRIADVCRPHWGLRTGLAIAQLLTLAGLYWLFEFASSLKGSDQLSDFLQGFDAAISLAIFTAGAGFFVWSLEGRWKRGKALKALHDLRAIVHVIDMHQLTKDPSMLGAARTSSSPNRQMTPFELMRYLDYCSEMLSLTAKIAALYAENIADPVVVDTVGDIERLTSALSAKIWQKISMVQQLEGRDMPLPSAPPISIMPSPL